MFTRRFAMLVLPVALVASACQRREAPGDAGQPQPPATRKMPVTDTYHGVAVTDDYRWLEDWSDPAVRAWSDAQNQYARSILDRLPGVDAIREGVAAIRRTAVPRYGSLQYAGGTLFALKTQPPKQQAVLVSMISEEDVRTTSVVVDPTAIDRTGGTTIDWYVPSPDGKLVAVSLSEGGSERGHVHVFDVTAGTEVGELVHRVNYGTALGSLAWDQDGRGFYYTRYPREGERPAADLDFYVQVYHHRIGEPDSADRYELGRDFPRIAEYDLTRSPDGRYVLANVQNGDSGEFAQHLRLPDGRWLQLTRYADRIISAVFGLDDALYLLSRASFPLGGVLRVPLREIVRTGSLGLTRRRVIVAASDEAVLETFVSPTAVIPAESLLFVVEVAGGPQRVSIYDLDGHYRGLLPLAAIGSVGQIVHLRGRGRNVVLYEPRSYVDPPGWYRWTANEAGLVDVARTALTQPFPVDFADIEVSRIWAVSKDGARVPMNVLARKGTVLDGRNPTLLTGYGGFGISETPSFDPGRRLWLDRGGVYVVANLRGGGEFGEAWHRAGSQANKQRVFDDFIACAEELIRRWYTSPDKLAIEGGSNGGLLMGAALTERPDLFKAVVSHVGIYDMLRVELAPNGAFNVPEYGTVKDSGQFRALYAYSPYHHVTDGQAYPAILFMTGRNDARVDPMHSRKMTAKLQAAGAGLVLLRTSATTGHGGGTPLDARIAEDADVLAFLFDQLDMRKPER
jgi:prolyl oligopeptidase